MRLSVPDWLIAAEINIGLQYHWGWLTSRYCPRTTPWVLWVPDHCKICEKKNHTEQTREEMPGDFLKNRAPSGNMWRISNMNENLQLLWKRELIQNSCAWGWCGKIPEYKSRSLQEMDVAPEPPFSSGREYTQLMLSLNWSGLRATWNIP